MWTRRRMLRLHHPHPCKWLRLPILWWRSCQGQIRTPLPFLMRPDPLGPSRLTPLPAQSHPTQQRPPASRRHHSLLQIQGNTQALPSRQRSRFKSASSCFSTRRLSCLCSKYSALKQQQQERAQQTQPPPPPPKLPPTPSRFIALDQPTPHSSPQPAFHLVPLGLAFPPSPTRPDPTEPS